MNRVDDKSAIARAIRRSRRTRAALQARRRRSVAIAGVLAVSLAGAGTWSIGALTGADMVQAAVTQAKSLADMLNERSPGERTEELLVKTKHAKSLVRQRAAAPPLKKQAAVAPKVNMTDIARLLQAPPTPLAVAPPELGAFAPPIALATPPSLGGFVMTPPSGGPPGGGSPPASFPTPQPKITVPSAVPEPGTWATMLLGFALIGWRFRRRSSPQPKRLQA